MCESRTLDGTKRPKGGALEGLQGCGGHSFREVNLLSVLISQKMPYNAGGTGQSYHNT